MRQKSYDAVVVGSGPNGLGAAVTLAKAGRSVLVVEGQSTFGGGARTLPLTLPGFQHDLCSAIHPLAAASPLFRSLDLAKHGLEWIHPDVPLAHPLDDGTAAVLHRSLEKTAATLGPDGEKWISVMKPFVDRWEDFHPTIFQAVTRLPKTPILTARFGLHSLRSAVEFCEEEFEGPHAKALFMGCAAHSFGKLTWALTSAFGMVLGVTGHAVGWPVLKGGSQALTNALLAELASLGGDVEASRPISKLGDLPISKVVLFDTTPAQMVAICRSELSANYARSIESFRRGPGVFKLDYALDGPMPWKSPELLGAGTVHLGGTLPELARSEAQVNDGEAPSAPYVLVAQQSLFDSTRAPAGQHTLWAYCHVPNGCNEDMTPQIEAQLERFAPGFKKRVLHKVAKAPRDFEAGNANYLGGDISGGSVDGLQAFFRPNMSLKPWCTSNPKFFLASSSTPPGPGVHGMCGYWAAQEALKAL